MNYFSIKFGVSSYLHEFRFKPIIRYKSDDDLEKKIDRLLDNTEKEILITNKELGNLEFYLRKYIESKFSEVFTRAFRNMFGCRIDDLIPSERDSMSIKFKPDLNRIKCILTLYYRSHQKPTKLQCNVKLVPFNFGLNIYIRKLNENLYEFTVDRESRNTVTHSTEILIIRGKKPPTKTYIKSEIISKIIDIYLLTLKDIFSIHGCYYLPAARSGLMQVYKNLAASMIRDFPLIMERRGRIERKIPSIISEFISTLIEINPEHHGDFYEIADKFEEKILHGKITVESRERILPHYVYKFQNRKIGLERVSSTVTELTPLFLYLKHILKKNDILIIEEPEAHLHPENQKLLAELLVNLVRRGLRIIVTTHSDYLLRQLSNLILSGLLDGKSRDKLKYGTDLYLKKDEIGVYRFIPDENGRLYTAQEVRIDDEGIPDDEFYRIDEILYREFVRLRREIDEVRKEEEENNHCG